MQHSDIDVEIIGDIICPTSEEDSCTWFLQALPVRDPVFTVATCHWDPRLSKRGPIGDPIFSEMGTKWGPSAAEWGPKKQMFAKLIETR